MTLNISNIKDRIGIDFGSKMLIEDAVDFSLKFNFKFIDIRIGDNGNSFKSFDKKRILFVLNLFERYGLNLGLHSLSAVNMAETAPYLKEAVDCYIKTYIDLAQKLNAQWVEVHAGYHFTEDYQSRIKAALDRLYRMADYAAQRGVTLFLENMNPEPKNAEVHYLASDIEETKYFFDNLNHENVFWSYTVNHAHILPEGIQGFYKKLGNKRLGEVRLADNNGDKEQHLFPGKGNIDFNKLFKMIENDGFKGHYMLAFGSPRDMVSGRDYLINQLRKDIF